MVMPVGLPGTSTGALGRSSGMRLMPGLTWLRYGLKAMLGLLANEGVTGKEVMGCSWAPGSMNCICWASMAAAVFCWIRLFLPFISSWVLRWGGGCRYLQLSRVQRPLSESKQAMTRPFSTWQVREGWANLHSLSEREQVPLWNSLQTSSVSHLVSRPMVTLTAMAVPLQAVGEQRPGVGQPGVIKHKGFKKSAQWQGDPQFSLETKNKLSQTEREHTLVTDQPKRKYDKNMRSA